MGIKCIEKSELDSFEIFKELEYRYNINISEEYIQFIKNYNGGIPVKNIINIQYEEYEIRYFVSYNINDYNYIGEAFGWFLQETKKKMIPIAKDSGDSYYCYGIDSGEIFYWDREINSYKIIFKTINELEKILTV